MAESNKSPLNLRKKGLKLDIRPHDANGDRVILNNRGCYTAPVSTPSSPVTDRKDRSKTGRKGSGLLQHFLHPLNFYHERKLRSSNSSINSDFGESDFFPRSNPNSRPGSPSMRSLFRRRTTIGTSCPSPLVPSSPNVSRKASPVSDFYFSASKNPSNRYPDGHEISDSHQSSHTSVPKRRGPPSVLNRRASCKTDSRPHHHGKDDTGSRFRIIKHHQRSSSVGNEPYSSRSGGGTLSDSSDSTSDSSSGHNTSSSESLSSANSSLSSSASSSYSGSHSSLDSCSEDELSTPAPPTMGTKRVSIPVAKRDELRRPSSDNGRIDQLLQAQSHHKSSSTGVSPVNKFLLSVMCQEGAPMKKKVEKSSSYSGYRKKNTELEDEVFADNIPKEGSFLGQVSQKAKSENFTRASSVERLYSVYEQIIKEGTD